jgi:MoxR-like ATPase
MATQNPIENEGTYQLPEAQVDRFMLKVLVGYPSTTEEFVIVERQTSPRVEPRTVLDVPTLAALQQQTDNVYVDPALIDYAVRVSTATRDPGLIGLNDVRRYVTFGASPRASINMILAGKALALLRGRDYARPEDVRDLALDVLRHRVVLSYEALADNVSADELVTRILQVVPPPTAPLHDRRPDHVPPTQLSAPAPTSTQAASNVSNWAPDNA